MRAPRSQQSTARVAARGQRARGASRWSRSLTGRAGAVAALALLLAATACSNSAPQQVADGAAGDPAATTPQDDGATPGSGDTTAATEGSGAPAGAQRNDSTEQTGASATAPGGSEPSAAANLGGDEVAPEVPPAPPAPDIFATMAAAGFERVHEEDLADYLPVPPRSEGQVGQFRADGQLVRIARVTYPAARFADPHERWLRERIAVLTTRFERVLRVGPTVVHIDADSAELAARAEAAFAPLMPGWDQATPGMEARP